MDKPLTKEFSVVILVGWINIYLLGSDAKPSCKEDIAFRLPRSPFKCVGEIEEKVTEGGTFLHQLKYNPLFPIFLREI